MLGLAQDLPRVWRAAAAQERKRILRLVVREVALDQRRERGMVWARIVWQTGAASEHRVPRRVRSYAECAVAAPLERRVRELNAAGKMDLEIASALNAAGFATARGASFTGGTVHLLRRRWGIRTVRINGAGRIDGAEANPLRWPDGSHSVRGAAAALAITTQTVFDWLRKGRLAGRRLAKGQPWQITLPGERITALAAQVRRTKRSRREAP